MAFIVPNVVLEKDEHGNYVIPSNAEELAQKIRDTGDQRFSLFDEYEHAKIAATHREVNQESIEGKGFPIIEVAVKPLKKASNRRGGTTERNLGPVYDYDYYTVEPTDSNSEGEKSSFEIHMVNSNHLDFGKATFDHLGDAYADNEIDLSGVQINEMEATPMKNRERTNKRATLVKIAAQNLAGLIPEDNSSSGEDNRGDDIRSSLTQINLKLDAQGKEIGKIKQRLGKKKQPSLQLHESEEGSDDFALPLANAAVVTEVLARDSVTTTIEQVVVEQNDDFQLPPQADTTEETTEVAQRAAAANQANRTEETEQPQPHPTVPVVDPAVVTAADPAAEPTVEVVPPAAPVPAVSFLRRAFNAVFNWKNAERAAHVAAFGAGAYAFVHFGGPAYAVGLLAKAGYTALSANALLGVQLGSLVLAGLAVERVGSFVVRRTANAIQNWRRPAPANDPVIVEENTVDEAARRLNDLLQPNPDHQINVDRDNDATTGAAAITPQLRNSQQPKPAVVTGAPDADATPPRSPSPSIH